MNEVTAEEGFGALVEQLAMSEMTAEEDFDALVEQLANEFHLPMNDVSQLSFVDCVGQNSFN